MTMKVISPGDKQEEACRQWCGGYIYEERSNYKRREVTIRVIAPSGDKRRQVASGLVGVEEYMRDNKSDCTW